jgi:hypothetical protein
MVVSAMKFAAYLAIHYAQFVALRSCALNASAGAFFFAECKAFFAY